MKPNHISFDCWDTLIKPNPEYKIKRNKLIQEIIFYEVIIDNEIINNVKRFCDFNNEVTGLQLTWEQSILLVIRDLYKEFDKNQLPNRLAEFNKKHKELFLKYPPSIYSDETIEILEELKRKKISINLLANTSFVTGNMLWDLFNQNGLNKYINKYMFSDWEGISKPNPKIFQRLKGLFNTKKIIHVGDNQFSDGGCESEGIKFLWINGKSGNTIKKVLEFI